MPAYIDVIQFEESVPPRTIRLIKSGEFYRAYNHSAWLFYSFIAEHKVMRKYLKVLKCDIYYIGFPEKSLFSNIGERKSIKTEYGFDIELLETEMYDEAAYETWKASVDSEHSSKGDYYSLPPAGVAAEKEVIRLLRDFPIESKSMIECVVFLTELRKMLNNT